MVKDLIALSILRNGCKRMMMNECLVCLLIRKISRRCFERCRVITNIRTKASKNFCLPMNLESSKIWESKRISLSFSLISSFIHSLLTTNPYQTNTQRSWTKNKTRLSFQTESFLHIFLISNILETQCLCLNLLKFKTHLKLKLKVRLSLWKIMSRDLIMKVVWNHSIRPVVKELLIKWLPCFRKKLTIYLPNF